VGGQELCRQVCFRFAKAGFGVAKGHDHTLTARKAGVLQWMYPGKDHLRVRHQMGMMNVIPWDYVDAKCEFGKGEKDRYSLFPKEFKPWMVRKNYAHVDCNPSFYRPREHSGRLRRRMMGLRDAYLQTEEYAAHKAKKDAKKEKTKAIKKAISAWRPKRIRQDDGTFKKVWPDKKEKVEPAAAAAPAPEADGQA